MKYLPIYLTVAGILCIIVLAWLIIEICIKEKHKHRETAAQLQRQRAELAQMQAQMQAQMEAQAQQPQTVYLPIASAPAQGAQVRKKVIRRAPTVLEKPLPAEETPVAEKRRTGDSFIDGLTAEEQQNFFKVFLNRRKGEYGIPAYKPGGNNKAFFEGVFVHFHEVRDQLDLGLVEKLRLQVVS